MGSRKGFPYQRGFGNEFQTEAVPGALPLGQNNPQACPHGLYAEQLSGTAFTVPRKSNQRTWLYRTLPSVVHGEYERVSEERAPGLWARGRIVTPERLRWRPRALPSVPTGQGAVDFVRGLLRVGESGSAAARDGLSVYSYVCNQSMRQCALYSADGDWLIVPQQGMLLLQTELGYVHAGPCECVVVPRGIRFRVSIQGDEDTAEPVMARGFVLEVYHGHWELPDLGVIGANGCAAPRDFEYPVAAYDAPSSGETAAFTVFAKFNNELFAYRQPHSPFNVVAWHGNYAPCRYDLRRFCPVNAVRFDHMDPSIFTVLTCRSNEVGVALADFVVFPPRWHVQEHTFRPPYFHRNCMTEFMMNLSGAYDAKQASAFAPGACSLHSMMSAHGPDVESYERAAAVELMPQRVSDENMAAMFETSRMLLLTPQALQDPSRDLQYISCWQGYRCRFGEERTEKASQRRNG
ncbi:hypothetical protein CDCA_CDCA01G0287 [Cyanidium caldarium]|uniref:homogentisate 1,2-dioxygenase n=1 Tax=Cyanidium caldarium TaxID=2771 RepID=A0AAV9IPT1_CYACA|nr:hypothetical protein CDCA_CDCA01G0287 [Cyanidium caldarium]